MNTVQWNLGLNFNALQLSNPRLSFASYIKPLMNKYLPDLKGMLISVDKRTLKLHPSRELATPYDNESHGIVRFHPEESVAKVCMSSFYFRLSSMD